MIQYSLKFAEWFNTKFEWFFTNGYKYSSKCESLIDKQHLTCMEELNTVKNALDQSRECGLDTEVVVWALKCMKEDPTLTVSEAIELGFWEWAK